MMSEWKSDAMRGVELGVQAWEETVVIPTYPAMDADLNPMFLEKRVYQGSSGKVYPLPFIDRVSTEKVDREYRALHLENEYVYLMILPEIGGRIQIGFDKLAGYDFFYRQDVIKPALVGLAGPWISGGVEFNWPQHHRPSTFMPCEWSIEESGDGSTTIWLSEHDPMSRMKGMHGICLRPGSSVIELKARLYNRTPYVQTFLWWANVAAKVHEQYQSFFPPDVKFVADHAKRATVSFPHVSTDYYGVRYGERGIHGVPAEEMPGQSQPDGTYSPDRLDWYSNIPVPTSYMVLDTKFDFFGGYDHRAKAGFVHIADRRIAPGKKQWTWGNHEFGYAWDRNLTDSGGPYIELMAGVYTDNQPDFSFLAPHETKTFSQFWYPIREVGVPYLATEDAAISLTEGKDVLRLGICSSRDIWQAHVDVFGGDALVWSQEISLSPRSPYVIEIPLPLGEVQVALYESGHEVLKAIKNSEKESGDSIHPPEPATEPCLPEYAKSNEELYLTGIHLDQYRHATRHPEDYWREALRRDLGDSLCHHALGVWHFRRGELVQAEEHLQQSVSRLTARNPNPRNGEPNYDLGGVLEKQGRLDEAYDAFAKAAWNYAWKGCSNFAMARIACRRGLLVQSLKHLETARLGLGDANAVLHLQAAILRKLGRETEGLSVAESVLNFDPLDHGALYEASLVNRSYSSRFLAAMRQDVQNYLDLAFDYIAAGLLEDATEVLAMSPPHLMVAYTLESLGSTDPGTGSLSLDYVFPHRIEEMLVLQEALDRDPRDGRAAFLLGTFMYDRRRYGEAIQLWELSVEINPSNSVAWRNLGIAYYNHSKDPTKSLAAYDRALLECPTDARVLFERDQLWKRMGLDPHSRLEELERHLGLVLIRDDLSLEYCSLCNATGKPERSLEILESRQFAPWEGGEGVALGQHSRTHKLLARKASKEHRHDDAVRLLRNALTAPRNLGEARHLLSNASDLWVALGDALNALGDTASAEQQWKRAAEFRGDFQEMAIRTFSEMTYYKALAMQRLARFEEAERLLRDLYQYARGLKMGEAKIDYFATSLPALLLFDEDLQERQMTTARFMAAQAALGLGQIDKAETRLRNVLTRDPNHADAQDLSAELASA